MSANVGVFKCSGCGYQLWDPTPEDIDAHWASGHERAAFEDPEANLRPCPACGAPLKADETHWSLFPEPMGGYICPVPA